MVLARRMIESLQDTHKRGKWQRSALEANTAERQFSTEFVIEMALSQFLNVDGGTFEDCDPVLNPGKLREQVEILQYQLAAKQSV
jgi:hypothetical protein